MQTLSLEAAEKVTGGLHLAYSCSSPAHALEKYGTRWGDPGRARPLDMPA